MLTFIASLILKDITGLVWLYYNAITYEGSQGVNEKKSRQGTKIAIHLLLVTLSLISPLQRDRPQELHDVQYAALSHRKYRYSSFSLSSPPPPEMEIPSHPKTPKLYLDKNPCPVFQFAQKDATCRLL